MSFGQLLQKYLLRPCDRLYTTYRLPVFVVLGIAFVAGCVLIGIYNHATDPAIIAPVVLLFFLPLLGMGALFVLPMVYEHGYDQARDLKLAKQLIGILNTSGPLPAPTLKKHYNAHHRFPLPLEVRKLVTQDYTQHLFTYDMRTELVSATGNTQPRHTVPVPVDGDYKTAYYQLYARLRAIREQPELVTMQDSLIDDLYGIG